MRLPIKVKQNNFGLIAKYLQIGVRSIGGWLLLWVTTTTATDSITATEQLHQVEIRIQKLQAEMHNTRTQYGRLQRQLQDREEDIGEVAQKLEQLHGTLVDKENTLADLKKQQQFQQQQLIAQSQVLAQQIRSAYIMGRQDYLKLWLNQQEPFTIGRMLTYYSYFNRARTSQIASIQATLKHLQKLEPTIRQESNQLNQLVTAHSSKQHELQLSYKERQAILAQLANTLENQDKELKRLQEDKHQLELLLGTLGNTIKVIPPTTADEGVGFAQLKGLLDYPLLAGQIVNQFGGHLVGNLRWQGMLIAAPLGEKIRVIAPGRVVFAQWFRHFGLLIIIDHGQGYMSLYAHNQSLFAKTGDEVTANEIIATVGNSGGRKISALYFEIRYQGVPINPQQWLNHSFKLSKTNLN
ncbi:MAG: peptidoglycan DD-metalloendopeptidase family protein [Thioploca sp.]|nr:peptidoglycan DD-metalloendopeptidase family protein [Thioploca sp.]